MEDFIKAVKQVEDLGPGSEPLVVLKRLRRAAGLNDAFIQRFLSNSDSAGPELDASLSEYIRKVVHHRVTEDSREEGVVLTPDGTTVALRPLLLGIEAGFLTKSQGLHQLTLAKDLGRALGSPAARHLGPDGCWDSVTSPQVFTLSDSPSLLTTAQVNGGMDGTVLGMEVSGARSRHHPLRLSGLLTEYYCHQLESGGLDAAPRLIGRLRRENFKGLVLPLVLVRQVVKSVELQRRLKGQTKMEAKEKKQVTAAVKKGVKEFVDMYMGEYKRKSSEKKTDPKIVSSFPVILQTVLP